MLQDFRICFEASGSFWKILEYFGIFWKIYWKIDIGSLREGGDSER